MTKVIKHTTYTNSMEIIPMDTLINILSRIPIKPLLTLKSVCKSWYSLITSSYFTTLHFKLNSPSYENLLIFVGHDHTLYSVSLDSTEHEPVKIPFSSTWERFSRRKTIIGTCNGILLCICDESSVSEALLINPSTLPCKTVPKLHVPNNCLYLSYGFGYDFLNADYKIVRIAQFLRCTVDVSVGLYSLSSDTWKLLPNVAGAPRGTPVSCNGALVNNHLLHWLFTLGSVNEQCRIFCIDVCREQWGAVELPYLTNVGDSRNGPKDLGVLDKCLCMLVGGGDVWVMKEYGVEESWVKLFGIVDWCVIEPLSVVPIVYSKEGNEILLRKDVFSSAYWYDLSEKRVRNAEFLCLPTYRQVSVCSRSLVSLCSAS